MGETNTIGTYVVSVFVILGILYLVAAIFTGPIEGHERKLDPYEADYLTEKVRDAERTEHDRLVLLDEDPDQ